MIAEYVKDGSVLDENHLEGWSVAQIKFWLQVDNVGETNIDALRLEKWSGEEVVGV